MIACLEPVPPAAALADQTAPQLNVPGLALRAERSGATVHLEVRGELDPHNSRYLELAGVEALDQSGVKLLRLDCAAVTHVGSNGLSALIELSRVAEAHSARLQIQGPSKVLLRLLDLAGLHRLLTSP